MNLLEELHSLHQEFWSQQPTKLSKRYNIFSLQPENKTEDPSVKSASNKKRIRFPKVQMVQKVKFPRGKTNQKKIAERANWFKEKSSTKDNKVLEKNIQKHPLGKVPQRTKFF